MKKKTAQELDEMKCPYIILRHQEEEPEIVAFDELDREHTWLEHAVLLPWTTPQRLFGWVHPAVRGSTRNGFTLHGAYMYHGSYAIQPTGDNTARFVPGPKALLPYEFISAVDVDVQSSPITLWMKDQAPEFRALFVELVKRLVFPPSQIEVASALPQIGPSGRKA